MNALNNKVLALIIFILPLDVLSKQFYAVDEYGPQGLLCSFGDSTCVKVRCMSSERSVIYKGWARGGLQNTHSASVTHDDGYVKDKVELSNLKYQGNGLLQGGPLTYPQVTWACQIQKD